MSAASTLSRLLPALLLCSACATAGSAKKTTASAAAPTPAAGEIEVVHLPASKSPAVTIRLLFHAGSMDDPAGREGATALAAYLMAEGGTEALTATQLKETLFPWAARISTQVDAEMTAFSVRVHRDHLDGILPILADVLLRPRFDPSEFERLRRDAVDDVEKGLRNTNDEALGKEALSGLLYAGHPYGHYVGGTVAGLGAITLDELRAHARRVFTRARLRIGIGGGWPEELPSRVRAAFADLPAGEPAPEVPPAKTPLIRLLLVHKDAPAVAVSAGYHVDVDRRHPDAAALMLGLSAFGEHRQFHGRLMIAIRVLRGMNYGSYAYGEYHEQEGWSTLPLPNIGRSRQLFSIWLRPLKPDQALFALRAALHHHEKLITEGLTEEEVARAGRFLAGYTRLWEKNDRRRVGHLLDDAWYGTPERLQRFRDAIPSLDAATVNAALKRHLRPTAELRIVMVTADPEGLRDAILKNTPSPMSYNAKKEAALLAEDELIQALPLNITAEEIRVVKADGLF